MAKSKYVVFFLVLIIVLALGVVNTSSFVFYPIHISPLFISPPVYFQDPNESGVSVSLGANRTSAIITVNATTSTQELTINGGFETGPDYWYFVSGTYLTSAYWYDSFLGRTGVIEITGSIPAGQSDNAGIVQEVTFPSTELSSIELYIGYFFGVYFRTTCYVLAGLYDPEVGDWAWFGYTACSVGSWSEAYFSIPLTAVEQGKSYYVYAGVYIYNGFFLAQTYSYYMDYVHLYVQTANPSFSGVTLNIQDVAGSYTGKLVLTSYSFTGSVNASIWLKNFYGIDSSRIEIVNSNVVSSSTSEISFDVPPSGYVSLKIMLETVMEPSSSANLSLKFIYRRGDGVKVTYPLQLSIIDPGTVNHVGSRKHGFRKIRLAKFYNALEVWRVVKTISSEVGS